MVIISYVYFFMSNALDSFLDVFTYSGEYVNMNTETIIAEDLEPSMLSTERIILVTNNFLLDQIRNNMNETLELSSAISDSMGEVNSPPQPLVPPSASFSGTLNQNGLFNRLSNLTFTSQTREQIHLNIFQGFYLIARTSSNAALDLGRFLTQGFFSELAFFEVFTIFATRTYGPATSHITEELLLSVEEQNLYDEFFRILSKYKHIYRCKDRVEFFFEMMNRTKSSNETNYMINAWVTDYIEMIEELKQFKKNLPLYEVYDSQDIKSKFDFLQDEIFRLENKLNDLNKINKMSQSLFNDLINSIVNKKESI